jgi:hypothetical protein
MPSEAKQPPPYQMLVHIHQWHVLSASPADHRPAADGVIRGAIPIAIPIRRPRLCSKSANDVEAWHHRAWPGALTAAPSLGNAPLAIPREEPSHFMSPVAWQPSVPAVSMETAVSSPNPERLSSSSLSLAPAPVPARGVGPDATNRSKIDLAALRLHGGNE